MAASFTSNPTETFYPAGQPLIYTLQTSVTITDTFAFIVQVEENAVEIGKYYLKANSNNRAHFDLSRVIEGRTKVDASAYSSTTFLHDYSANYYQRANGGINKYTVKIGEYTGTEALNQASKNIYVVDGYEQVSAGLHPSFSDYFGTASSKKYWLTDRAPVGNIITMYAADEDEGFMALINKDSIHSNTVSDVTRLQYVIVRPGLSPLTVQKDLNTTNGAQLPSASSPTNGFLVYAAVMPSQVLALNSVTAWTEIVITPQNASGVQEGNQLQILPSCPGTRGSGAQVAFANSRGGWDFLRFDGFTRKTIRTEEKSYRAILGDYAATTYTFNSYAPETIAYQKTAVQAYALSGVFDPADAYLIPYLLRSKQVFAKIDGVWSPVRITDGSAPYKTTPDSQVTQFTLNVELAQTIRC